MQKTLTAAGAKKEFVRAFKRWIDKQLDENQGGNYKDCFVIEGDDKMVCTLPSNFFRDYKIPDNMKLEIKFTNKK